MPSSARQRRWQALLLAALMAVGCSRPLPPQPLVEQLNPMTPVKQPGASSPCWLYAMLAAIETEHIGRGDSVNLSAAWLESFLPSEPHAPADRRGLCATALQLLQRRGVVGYDAMRRADAPRPRCVFLYGAEYTPQEFARSVCAPGEYMVLTSSAAAPYGQSLCLSTPANWLRQRALNVPPDTLLRRVCRAVRRGHGVSCDVAAHAVALVGLARDTVSRQRYFVTKHSCATPADRDGLSYLSFADFRRHVVAVCMTRQAYHEP